MATFSAIDRIMIAVNDLENGVSSYRALLGRYESELGQDNKLGIRYARFRLLNSTLELIAKLPEEGSANPLSRLLSKRLESYGEGIMAIALRSEKMAASRNLLDEQGGSYTQINADSYLAGEQMLISESAGFMDLGIFIVECPDKLRLPLAKARAGINPASLIDDVDHIVLNSSDGDGLKSYLAEGLGLSMRLDQSRPEWGARQLFFRVGANILEVMEFLDEKQKAEHDHFWGIAFSVPDLDSCLERLAEDSVKVSNSRKGRKAGTKVATVKSSHCGIATLLISLD
ncbi:VOC family protein [uncultured Pseudoteredinibacter sp.]|uniref:VOC family protein n=1 Tax=uncultured Pseudoteredinibacter sp. TaxID=1641701 RepID=UPI002629C735|nr:VOC family protein [uncultured Pseudoteredinibacter sp.]